MQAQVLNRLAGMRTATYGKASIVRAISKYTGRDLQLVAE